MMTRVMSRESHHRQDRYHARVHIYTDKNSAGSNVVFASHEGLIVGWIGAGDKLTSPS